MHLEAAFLFLVSQWQCKSSICKKWEHLGEYFVKLYLNGRKVNAKLHNWENIILISSLLGKSPLAKNVVSLKGAAILMLLCPFKQLAYQVLNLCVYPPASEHSRLKAVDCANTAEEPSLPKRSCAENEVSWVEPSVAELLFSHTLVTLFSKDRTVAVSKNGKIC